MLFLSMMEPGGNDYLDLRLLLFDYPIVARPAVLLRP